MYNPFLLLKKRKANIIVYYILHNGGLFSYGYKKYGE